MNHYTCRIWLSTLKLGEGDRPLSSVVGVKKDKVRHPGNWSRPCKVPEMGARSLWRWRKISCAAVRPVSGPYSCLKLVPLLMGPLWCGHKFMMSRVSLCVLKRHHCKGITLQAAAC